MKLASTEVNFDDLESLKLAYHELLSNSSITKNIRKNFKNVSKEHTEFKNEKNTDNPNTKKKEK